MSTTAEPYPVAPPPAPQRRSSPLGLTAFIVGLVAIVGCLIPIVNNVSIVLGVIGLILGIIALVQKNRKRGLAITAVILSAIAIIAGLASQALYGAVLNKASEAIASASTAAFSSSHTIVYTVSGDSTDASVTWTTGSGSSTANSAALPWTKTVTVKGISAASVTATDGSTGSKVTCTISVDGKQVASNTGTGQEAAADCTYVTK